MVGPDSKESGLKLCFGDLDRLEVFNLDFILSLMLDMLGFI